MGQAPMYPLLPRGRVVSEPGHTEARRRERERERQRERERERERREREREREREIELSLSAPITQSLVMGRHGRCTGKRGGGGLCTIVLPV